MERPKEWPRITIVTPSFNQGRYIAATVESVLSQDYPNLEYIVVDAQSTDETMAVLARYPHVKVVSVPDEGHAYSINTGFQTATGDIFGYLNSDDTLLPGTLNRVAQEIDPARQRHIIMGRCQFVDEYGEYIGVEHPSAFTSHLRVLEVWRGHGIPQPATFWTRQVWETCGPVNKARQPWIDYDLFCRFSQKYHFHVIDQRFATYRLHPASWTVRTDEHTRLVEAINVSRHYWGSLPRVQYLQLLCSLAWHRFERIERARRWLDRAKRKWRQRQRITAIPDLLGSALIAPEMVFNLLIYPQMIRQVKRLFPQMKTQPVPPDPRTLAYMEKLRAWPDKWVGPKLEIADFPPDATRAVITGIAYLTYIKPPLTLTIATNGSEITRRALSENGNFRLEFPIHQGQKVTITADQFFVPHSYNQEGDTRPLAWRLLELSYDNGQAS